MKKALHYIGTRLRALLLWVTLGAILTGCQSFTPSIFGKNNNKSASETGSIGNLLAPTKDEITRASPKHRQNQPESNPSLQDIIRFYRESIIISPNESNRAHAQERLSQLEAKHAENQFVEQAEGYDKSLENTIDLMTSWLRQNKSHTNRAPMLYQLAKVLELKGDRETSINYLNEILANHPKFQYIDEVEFRLGEDAYSLTNYQQANNMYRRVANRKDSKYIIQAYYMLGWSYFKLGSFIPAYTAFDEALELLSIGQLDTLSNQEDDTFDNTNNTNTLDFSKKHQASIETDTLRTISLILEYIGHVDFLNKYYEDNIPDYAVNIYTQHAEYLLKKKRYLDAHQVYTQFQSAYTLHLKSAKMGVRSIEALETSGFFNVAREAKQRFIHQYAPDTQYYLNVKGPQTIIDNTLPNYLTSLSRHAHSKAQKEKQKSKKILNYTSAIDLYETFLKYYPTHKDAPNKRFLLAEALFSIEDFQASAEHFETYAYDSKIDQADTNRKAEAGYKALTAYQRSFAKALEKKPVLKKKLASQIGFLIHFPEHIEADNVRLQTAEDAFQLEDYPLVMSIANPLLGTTLAPNKDITIHSIRLLPIKSAPENTKRSRAISLMADAAYNLNDYKKAATLYRTALQYYSKHSESDRWAEHYGNCLYQLAKAYEEDNQHENAILLLTQLSSDIPNHTLAAASLYNAGTLFTIMKQYDKALSTWNSLRKRYPSSEVTQDLPIKLANIYEAKGDWLLAAEELTLVSQQEGLQIEVKRSAALESARLFERSKHTSEAINAYETYLQHYPNPLEMRTTVEYKLSELYFSKNDSKKGKYWLQQIIDSDNTQKGSNVNVRAYALKSSSKLAKLASDQYFQIKLGIPLNKSFKRKEKAMRQCIIAYQHLMAYETTPYYNEAIYSLGDIFHHLSKDLLNAPKPTGLSELALEEYEILLEEQAYPFEEKAIEFHQTNILELEKGTYNEWVSKSIQSLGELIPSQFKRNERKLKWLETIY